MHGPSNELITANPHHYDSGLVTCKCSWAGILVAGGRMRFVGRDLGCLESG